MELGKVQLDFLGHAGFAIRDSKRTIIIDPYNISQTPRKADIILLTHSHYDHCSIKDIEKVAKAGTKVIMTADCQSKVMKLKDITMEVVEVGDKLEVSGVKIEAVAAYNINKEFHPKSEGWVGYVLKLGDVIVYHAGDTDFIPEMQKLTGHGKHGRQFVALMPVSGTYVMDAEEAADAASLLSPDLAIPMHFGAGVAGTREDAERFVELCAAKGLQAEILQKL